MTSNTYNLKIKDDYFLNNSNICCPKCGEYNGMHLKRTIHYCRKEDEEEIIRITVDSETGFSTVQKIKNEETENPSSRRDGMQLFFHCEHGCLDNNTISLNIDQHKGSTYAYWK